MKSPKWDSAPAPLDLDALVREAKRLFGSEGIPWHLATHGGMTDKYIRAFNLFLRAAEAGHSEAQDCVGVCYGYGHGVPKIL
jgi:TPR repeat protein